jgi:hypothetical protein
LQPKKIINANLPYRNHKNSYAFSIVKSVNQKIKKAAISAVAALKYCPLTNTGVVYVEDTLAKNV